MKPNKKKKNSQHSHGEKCPICQTTLEWSQTKECDNCGYDKP